MKEDNDFDLDVSQLVAATGLSPSAARKLVAISYETFGRLEFGWCVQQVEAARRKMMIAETEAEEERLSKLNPPFWRR
jgi:hypothetical protein